MRMVGSCGVQLESENVLAHVPRTKRATFFLLDRIQRHFLNSGKNNCPVFDCPQESSAVLGKLIKKVNQKWVRNRKTSKKDLQVFRRMKKVVRRVQYQNNVVVFTKATVPHLRAAVPQMYGQGFLRHPVRVHPYRSMDTFLGRHRVNVYRQGKRFDVIDALCNIPILAGLTKQGLKKVVEW